MKFKLVGWAILSIFIVSCVFAQTVTNEVSFYTGAGEYECVKNNFEASWRHISSGEIIFIFNSTSSTTGVCNNFSYNGEWCCPKNYECNSEGKCVQLDIKYSGDVCTTLSKEACNTSSNVFASSLMNKFDSKYLGMCGSGSFGVCTNITTCSCAWDENKKKCALLAVEKRVCLDGTISSANCSWVEDFDKGQDLCGTEGKLIVVYSATGESVDGKPCEEQRVEYPCTVSVQLPFFDKFTFILSVLAIVGIYFFYSKLNLTSKLV